MTVDHAAITMSDPLLRRLERFAEEGQTDVGEIIRRALQLYDVAHHAVREGKRVGIVGADGRLEREFIGL